MGLDSKKLLPSNLVSLSSDLEKLLINSVTASTWRRHRSASNLFGKFCENFGIVCELPITIEVMRAFVTWTLTNRKLQSSTIESYISSLATMHNLAGVKCAQFSKDRCIILALNGGKNIALRQTDTHTTRLSMNIHLLSILGHRIAKENWDKISKQVVWTAAVVSFYTSCRMGEILPNSRTGFDASATMKWGNVKFIDQNEILMFLPYTKTTGYKGAIIDLFPINNSTCPVAALSKLKNLYKSNDLYSTKNPVFMFTSGKFLTVQKMNEILEGLLTDFTDSLHKITCHSFRAGLPSVIAANPDKSGVQDLKEWGRWHTDSYEKYTKQDREKKRVLFYRYVNML